MDTTILRSRIIEYKSKATHPTSKEMITLFETWFTTIESYLSDVELDNFRLNKKVEELHESVSILCDIIILSGQSAKIDLVNFNDPYVKKAIELLLKSKDRKNHDHILAIAGLLNLHDDIEFKSVKELKEYVAGN